MKEALDNKRHFSPLNPAEDYFVKDFHQILDRLQELGNISLRDFYVPSEICDGGVCNIDYLLSKINGLLNLFHISEDKRKMGFITKE